MFTLKKLALVGIAGLSAFAISCSDEADDAGGKFTTPFSVTDGNPIILGGVIAANDGANIVNVEVKADGSALTLTPTAASLLPATTFDLSDVFPSGACDGKSGTVNIKFEVSATFSEGDKLTEAKTVSIACSGSGPGAFVKWAFTLSNAQESFADLDARKTYKNADIPAMKDIDLLAFTGNVGSVSGDAGNKVYTTWDLVDGVTGGAMFYELETVDEGAVRIATSLADLAGLMDKLEAIADAGNDVEGGIAISATTAFLVLSSSHEWFAIRATSANVAGKTVSFEAIPLAP